MYLFMYFLLLKFCKRLHIFFLYYPTYSALLYGFGDVDLFDCAFFEQIVPISYNHPSLQNLAFYF